MNRAETSKVVLMLSATLQQQNGGAVGDTDGLISGWHLVLEPVPYAEAEQAVRAYLRTEKWFPAPSELLAVVAHGAPTPYAGWQQALDHLRASQPPNLREFAGHEFVRQAVKAVGGWSHLRNAERPDREREAFLAAYAEVLAAAVRDVADPAQAVEAGGRIRQMAVTRTASAS